MKNEPFKQKMVRIEHWKRKGDIIAIGICRCCGHQINVRERDFAKTDPPGGITGIETKLKICRGCGNAESKISWIKLPEPAIFSVFSSNEIVYPLPVIKKKTKIYIRNVPFMCPRCEEGTVIPQGEAIARCDKCGHKYRAFMQLEDAE